MSTYFDWLPNEIIEYIGKTLNLTYCCRCNVVDTYHLKFFEGDLEFLEFMLEQVVTDDPQEGTCSTANGAEDSYKVGYIAGFAEEQNAQSV